MNRSICEQVNCKESDSTNYGVFLLNILNFTVCITHENNLDKDDADDARVFAIIFSEMRSFKG